jgi:prepilin-type N-terminal cleavage/methylation domain-containing protein
VTARSRDRRRAQSGTTLIELLVAVTIMGLALTLIVGSLSAGLMNSVVAKRNTAAQAVIQYELDSISASQFSSTPPSYSECFATDSSTPPVAASGYQQSCPSGSFALRADVTWSSVSSTIQLWTVTVTTWPSGAPVGSPVFLNKVRR